MNRINRLARSLIALSDRETSRIAVRPFPLTPEMKQIITEATGAFQRAVAGMNDGSFQEWEFYVYESDGVQLGNNFIPLVVVLEIVQQRVDPVVTGYVQLLNEGTEDLSCVIVVKVPSEMIGRDPSALQLLYRDFQVVLNHELVHAMDPKFVAEETRSKMPAYVNPLNSPGDMSVYESYVKHPMEKSAYEGSLYYYFHDSASRGVPLKKAINDSLQGTRGSPSEYYQTIIRKSGQKGWQEYLTRLYKSAEQAYEEAAKERQTQG